MGLLSQDRQCLHAQGASTLAAERSGWATPAISLLLVATHALFAFAQFADASVDCPELGSNTSLCPQWPRSGGLVRLSIVAHVEYDARETLAAGAAALQEAACHSNCETAAGRPSSDICDSLLCDGCASIGSVSLRQRCAISYDQTMMQLSYFYAVRDLWSRDMAPSCLVGTEPSCTGHHPGRAGAVALLVCSFVWPHVKLLLLHALLYLSLRQRVRRHSSYWLAAFGKWTVLDVLVISLIAALDQIRLDTSLPAAWQDLATRAEMRRACDALCTNRTSVAPPVPAPCDVLCELAFSTLDETLRSPEMLPSSHVTVRVPLTVERCMHSFCLAVVLSVTCSIIVEVLDERSAGKTAAETGGGGASSSRRCTSLVANHVSSMPPAPPQEHPVLLLRSDGRHQLRHDAMHATMLVLQILLTWSALSLPLVRRRFHGPVATFLEALGADIADADFSLLQLSAQVGGSGAGPRTAWDGLLSVTFSTFVIICPLLRPVTQLGVLLSPSRLPYLEALSRYLSFFHALEVLLVVVPVVQISLRIIFLDLITPRTFPLCSLLVPRDAHDRCIEIEVTRLAGYNVMIAAVALHLLTGFDGSLTHLYIQRRWQAPPSPSP